MSREVIAEINGLEITAQRGEYGIGFWHDKTQKTDWLAWRAVEHELVGTNGEVVEREYTVAVDDGSGQIMEVRLSAEHSTNPVKIIAATGLPLNIPADNNKAVATALSKYRFDQRETRVTYTSTGWQHNDDGWVFAAPTGSVTAKGIDNAIMVDSVRATRHVGWDRVPETPDEQWAAIEAIEGLYAIGTKTLGVALIGALFAAPLGINTRCGVIIRAQRGSGKTVALRCAYSAISVDPTMLPVSIPQATVAGAQAMLSWYRHLPCPLDDYRKASRKADADADAILEMALQGAYGGGLAVRAGTTGRARDAEIIAATPVITAETYGGKAATFERALPVTVTLGDIDLKDGGGVDQFNDKHQRNLRMAYAGYLQWLAQRANANGLESLSGEWHTREDIAALGGDRAAEHGAFIMAGWKALTAWAAELDFLLPDGISATIEGIVTETRGLHKGSAYGPELIEAIKGIIQSQRGVVTDWNGQPLVGDERGSWGWPVQTSGIHTGKAIGRLSQCRNYVIITRSAMKMAAKDAGLTIDPTQIAEALAEHYYVPDGCATWDPKKRGPRALFPCDHRPSGHLFRRGEFDDDDAD